MATTLLGENTVHTVGDLPGVGTKAPDFTLTSGDFTDVTKTVAVSQDLPFALASFCAAEGLENVLVGSAFRSGFGTDYGVTMADGGWRGLLARAVVVLDEDGTVLHAELTSAIGVEPDYDAAIAALR